MQRKRKEPAMGENVIQAVGQSDSETRVAVMFQLFQNQLYKSTNAAPASQPEKAEKPAAPEKVEDKQSLLPVTNADTFLRFMVDKKTNDITVYIVDRASNRIMRSIPPNEVNNLKAGDLLKLLA
jgi:uncharacterized FlaG/YvyC family protein